MEPRIQYAQTKDGVSIAYSVVGSGPPLVRVTSVLWNHVEAWWRIVPYRKMAERLAETCTFITYDARGTGLSPRGAEDFRMAARLLDLEAVLAALDIGRCAMLSHTNGCQTAVAYAVHHPERVSKLALLNPFARGVDFQRLPGVRARESYRAMAEEVWEEYRMVLAMSTVDNSDAELARQVAGVAEYVATHPETPLAVYVGLNAGEPIAEERDLFGTSVDLARRLCDEAGPGEILVSDVVRQLAAGKGFLFSDRGAAALKGFEDPVRLYEVRWQA